MDWGRGEGGDGGLGEVASGEVVASLKGVVICTLLSGRSNRYEDLQADT